MHWSFPRVLSELQPHVPPGSSAGLTRLKRDPRAFSQRTFSYLGATLDSSALQNMRAIQSSQINEMHAAGSEGKGGQARLSQ